MKSTTTIDAPVKAPTQEDGAGKVYSAFHQDAYDFGRYKSAEWPASLQTANPQQDDWQRFRSSKGPDWKSFSPSRASFAQVGDGTHTTWTQGAKNVGYEFGVGIKDEVVHHPGRVVGSAAIGFAAGVVGTFLAPEIGLAVAVGGIVYGGYQLYQHVPGWYHAAKVVANPGQNSPEAVAKAAKEIQDLGAGTTDLAAGIGGGVVGHKVGVAIQSMRAPVLETAPAKEIKPVQQKTNSGNAATTQIDGSQSGGDPTGGAPAGDNKAMKTKVAAPKETAKPAAPSEVVPAGLTVEQSTANSQASFRAALEQGKVLEFKKADYKVMFQKVSESGNLHTLETRGVGETIKPGDWIATALNPDGTPQMVNGVVNQWPVAPKAILKSYLATQEQIDTATQFIANTKTDGPSVFMFQLDKPLTFKTSWGGGFGKIEDMLANYDFNPKTGVIGTDFNVVDKTTFLRTYAPVKPPLTS